jgi:hypothetical protein
MNFSHISSLPPCQWHRCGKKRSRESYRYSAGQFARVCFLKVARASRIWSPKSQQCHIYTGVSYLHSGVIEHRRTCRSGDNDTAVICTAVSFTPLWHEQGCHWQHCGTNFVNYLREFEAIFEKALTWCIRDPGEVVWWKKTEVENLVSGSL